MSKQDEYREAAVASLRLAGAASNQSERMRMLALAEAWFKLAERSARDRELFRGIMVKGTYGPIKQITLKPPAAF